MAFPLLDPPAWPDHAAMRAAFAARALRFCTKELVDDGLTDPLLRPYPPEAPDLEERIMSTAHEPAYSEDARGPLPALST